MAYGVPVGSMKRCAFPTMIIQKIARFFAQQNIPVGDISSHLLSLKCPAERDELSLIGRFRIGTTCKIAFENGEVERIMEISGVGPVDGKYFVFVNGPYFIPTANNGNVINHDWTQKGLNTIATTTMETASN